MLADLFNRFINYFTAEEETPPPQEPRVQTAPKVGAQVQANASLTIILNAITQACSEFVRNNLTPVAEYSPQMGYAIRTIRLLVTPENAKLVQELSRMNSAMRDKLVASCIRKAQGSGQFSLENFFGLIFVGDEAILDGQLVSVLMCNDEHMAPLKFCFDGEYVDIAADKAPTPEADFAVDTPKSIALPERKPAQHKAPLPVEPTPIRETRLNIEPAGTRLSGSPGNAIARLVIRDAQGEENSVLVTQLPFEIGREIKSENGYRVADNCALVSRQHLRLIERQGNSLLVENPAARANGTYMQGQAQGARFIWHYSQLPDAPHWLNLGSRQPDAESIQIRLETI